MPNYTITRQIEPEDIIGCTNFETTETQDTPAVIGGGGGDVDGDIIWHIDALGGYTVDIDDFFIPSATNTNVTQIPFQLLPTVEGYSTWEGGLILPPILGVVMEQISATRIKVTVYLVPSALHGITGTPFSMPANNVSLTLPIQGCAVLSALTNEL
tara:strand:+ start:863 stop:1330 length:468 start_codon:yes stop_codon:yes gene_type:complete